MATLEIKKVRKNYGTLEVIHGIDLFINNGEFCVLVGPSGCGKSTLLRMIAGLEQITKGDILIDNQVVNNISAARRGLAMVFQSYALYPHMSVRQNLAFGLENLKMKIEEIDRRILEAARLLRMEEYLQRKPGQLSGGQKQRVAIGRAIVREPSIYLFDEPLSNLDAELRVATRVELKALHARLGNTMIYVTHDQVEAMTLADRIVILNQGNIEQVGTPEEIYNDPENIFVAQFIGTPKMNILEINEKNIISENTIKLLDNDIQFDKLKLKKSKHFIGIRPENLKTNQKTKFTFDVEIELIENLGNEKIAYMKKNEHQLSAKIPSNVAINNSIGIDLENIFIFDQNGKRLRN